MSGNHPVGIVLTGGASRRMGVDKATLVVDGVPMVVRVADAMWEAGCHPVECQGGDAVAIGEYGLFVAPDPAPGVGPLVAIETALQRHAGRDVVVAACDLVGLEADSVRSIITAGSQSSAPVAAGATGDDLHLISWWRAGAVEALRVAIADGVRSYREGIRRLGGLAVPVSVAAVRNVNTPSDLASGR